MFCCYGFFCSMRSMLIRVVLESSVCKVMMFVIRWLLLFSWWVSI